MVNTMESSSNIPLYQHPYNFSEIILGSAETLIQKKLVDSHNSIVNKVFSRCAYGMLIPVSLITRSVDTCVGLATWTFCVLTFGNKKLCTFTAHELYSSRFLLADPFKFSLKTYTPRSSFTIEADGESSLVKEKVVEIHTLSDKSELNDLRKHLRLRMDFAKLVIESIVLALLKTAFSVSSVSLAFYTKGVDGDNNTLAYNMLTMTGVVDDLFFTTMRVVNPWAKIPNIRKAKYW